MQWGGTCERPEQVAEPSLVDSWNDDLSNDSIPSVAHGGDVAANLPKNSFQRIAKEGQKLHAAG